jgi:archaetidylinositol phosphate synthase
LIYKTGLPVLTKLKIKVQKILASEARAAHKIGLTPNMVSLIGFTLAVLSAAAYATAHPPQFYLFLATILLLLSGFCDTLDGVLARTYRQASIFGGFLDSLLDRYADAFVYVGIIFSGLCNVWWGMAALLAALIGSLLVSYSRARAEAVQIKMESIGIAERPERVIILTVASLAAIFWLPALSAGILLLAFLSNFTVLQRGLHVYKSLKKKGIPEN